MLLFICPYCDELLRVPPQFLGKKGRCNKCGGRVALIGDPRAEGPQAASRVADQPAPGNVPGRTLPPTDKQIEYLRALGAEPNTIITLNRTTASELIDRLRADRQDSEPPTDKQVAYLRRLGATERQIAALCSKSEAAQLIEDLHLSPTKDQMETLVNLGAGGARIASLKTKAAAAAMIEELRETEHQ